jgi:hypothetical protein
VVTVSCRPLTRQRVEGWSNEGMRLRPRWSLQKRHWTCRTFSWPVGLNAILVAGIAACWDPAHGSPFERAAEVWSTCNWAPSSFSLACGCALPSSVFFACSSKPLRLAHTARPDDAAFFSSASSHSYNHNRSVSAMRGHRGRRIGEGPQAR